MWEFKIDCSNSKFKKTYKYRFKSPMIDLISIFRILRSKSFEYIFDFDSSDSETAVTRRRYRVVQEDGNRDVILNKSSQKPNRVADSTTFQSTARFLNAAADVGDDERHHRVIPPDVMLTTNCIVPSVLFPFYSFL